MPSIIGDSHKDYVKSQIKTRQEILGKKSRSSEEIAWENGKTAWVRLASSVDIKDQEINFYNDAEEKYDTKLDNGAELRQGYLGLESSGNVLSSQLVLEGGVLNNSSKKFGVSNTTSDLPGISSNYGFGGNQFGLSPMPGITNFSSKTNNKGSLRYATINIVAHNKRQFEYLETVYLRLGYTMLLEWGNSSYPKTLEDGTIIYEKNRSSLIDEFLNNPLEGENGTTYFYTQIEKFREETQGNYDGFLGRVQNFSWNFTKEGTYEITLELITIGSVIESLKLNVTYNDLLLDDEAQPLPSSETSNSLINTLKAISAPPPPSKSGNAEYVINFDVFDRIKNWLDTWDSTADPKRKYEYPAVIKNEQTGKIDVCNATFGQTAELFTYIRFGQLLDILNKYFLVLDSESNPALITLDTSEDQYCFSNSLSISSNPDKVIIRNEIDNEIGKFEIFSQKEAQIEPFHSTLGSDNEVRVGKIMNIYFSIKYLESLINDLSENDGENVTLNVYNLVKKLLDKAGSALGGLNKFNVRIVDKEFEGGVVKEVLEFYDEVSPFEIENLRNVKEDDPTFTIYGFNNGQGGFATDYSFQTSLSKNTSTMVAVGAQANGAVVGEDATLFSKWSIGLVDRIIPKKLDSDSFIKSTDRSTKSYTKLVLSYKRYINQFTDSTLRGTVKRTIEGDSIELSPSGLPPSGASIVQRDVEETYFGYSFPNCNLTSVGNKRSIEGFKSIQSSFFQRFYTLEASSQQQSTPFIGFIPANLSLTIDGLSGIRIFDKLKVDSKFLPPNYGNTLDFIITTLDHKIVNNRWETSVSTLSIPKSTKTLPLNLIRVFKDLPPITTNFESFVGKHGYKFSALARMIVETMKTREDRPGVGTGDNITLNQNGRLNLPHKFTDGTYNDTYQRSPLISIGNIKKVSSGRNGSFYLSSATTSINEDAVESNSTSAFKLQNQINNKKYYDGYYYLAEPAAKSLLEFGKFLEENYPDKTYLITSAYRSVQHQRGLKTSFPGIAASAGSSPHGWGGAIDINELVTRDENGKASGDPSLNSYFRETNLDYQIWKEHAPKFGWYNPLRLSDGIDLEESWHWEYWGVPGETITVPAPYDWGELSALKQFGNYVSTELGEGAYIKVPTLNESNTLAYNANGGFMPNLYTDRKTGKPTPIKPEDQ